MRGSAALCLVLACLAASLHVSQHEQLGAAPPAQQQQLWRQLQQEQRSLVRTRRQLSRVVILYRQLAKENREDQSQARQRIQDILDRVFAAPEVTSTMLPASVEAEEGGNATTTTTARPPPRIDRTMLLANLRRNLRGLGRLFMRELRAALSQTRKNFAEYGTQLRNSIG